MLVASGACNRPTVPALAHAVPPGVEQFTPFEYRNPSQLPDGGVLVVGASATGVQLAAELSQSGRPVILSVGEHVRLPRTYRGRDILWWMDASGVWDQRYDEVDDLQRARRLPSPQLVGTPERTTLDLNALSRWASSWWAAWRPSVTAARSSPAVCATCSRWPTSRWCGCWTRSTSGLGRSGASPRSALPSASPRREVPRSTRLELDLGSGEIRAIVWATGFRPDYRWLDVPVVDAKGHLRHDGGVVDSPGLYALGLPVLRRRKSTFIHGIEDDAREVIDHLNGYLAGDSRSHTTAGVD